MSGAAEVDVVDVHTHFMPDDLPDLGADTGDPRWPRLIVEGDEESGRVMRGDDLFRVVRRPCWDPTARLAEMDSVGVAQQVLSPIPVSLTYWGDPNLSLAYSRHVNDWLAEAVRRGEGRFLGLGTVPLQEPGLAIDEMKRVIEDLGLSGLEIGTVVDGLELNADVLRPFFRAADELHVPLFVHPTDGECATRVQTNPAIAFSLGMHTDTALAASALVFGGILRECRNLRVCLSHGGGAFPWSFPRMDLGGGLGVVAGEPTGADLARRLYVDSIVFDPDHLRLLCRRFGADHVVVGSDYPFFPLQPPHQILDDAVAGGAISAADRDAMRGANALDFLRRD